MVKTIDELISDISTSKNIIRTKLVSMGKVASSADLSTCAIAVQSLEEATITYTLLSGTDYEMTITNGIIIGE